MRTSLLLILLLSAIPAVSWAGNSVNNGIDQFDEKDDVAWFVGPRPISGCVEVADGFGVDADTAIQVIRQAFSIWDDYFNAKGLKETIFKVARLSLSTTIELRKGCSGDEDIAFYLGTQNPTVIQATEGFRHPLAFSHRSSYDETTRRGKGFVWLATPSSFAAEKLDWNRDHHLLGAILHEIGHVYGCGHISSTIMRAELSENILDRGSDFRQILNRIDSGKQLYNCELCGGSFAVKILHRDVVESLLGRSLAGPMKAQLTLADDVLHLPHGSLMVSDNTGSVEIAFETQSVLAQSFSDTLLFHIPAIPGDLGSQAFAARSAGTVYLTRLSIGSRALSLIYKKNTDETLNIHIDSSDQLVSLDPKDGGETLMIFEPFNLSQ